MSIFLTPHNASRMTPLRIFLTCITLIIGVLAQAQELSTRQTEQTSNKARLGEQIKSWVATQHSIRIDDVEPAVNDRRFKVPACAENFQFSFPFGGKGTVKATCQSPKWDAHIRIRIASKKPMTHGFIFTKKLNKGDILSESDIEMAVATRNYTGLASNARNIVGKSLAANVRQSDFIKADILKPTIEVYRTTKQIYAKDFFSTKNYKKVTVGIHMVTDQNRFKKTLLLGSRARRNIAPGGFISKAMVDTPYKAYAAKDTIRRGDRITDLNVHLRKFWGSRPAGSITSKKTLRLTQSARTLKEGDILRFSDLKPALLVKKGDNIVLLIEKGALQVSVGVEALANGKINDIIVLKNLESGENVRGRITGPGRAVGIR